LKPEQWGSPLVQEKYQEEKACEKRHPYRIIKIMSLNNLAETVNAPTFKVRASLFESRDIIFG